MSASLTTQFINEIPKAELHIHIEGSLEPELAFALAKKNNVSLKYDSVEQLRSAYNFSNLQDFLDIYYQNASALITESDFYELMLAYLSRAKTQNIMHAEIFFDPQTHTDRGISFDTVISGLSRAQVEGEKNGVSSKLIMCFLRHLDEDKAFQTLESALPYKNSIYAVGLDSSEQGNPPSKFTRVFNRALELGFKTVAHAGEEGSCDYVREAIELLHVSRIDHGNHALDDHQLVTEIVAKKIPLTVCPLSNQKLRVISNLKDHPLKKMLDMGIIATINSDDPAYFGGYINENFQAIANALQLGQSEIITLAKNSFIASFLNDDKRNFYLQKIDDFVYLTNSVNSF